MNSTTPYRPNWTYGSPAGKLSTYMTLYQLGAAIIRSVIKRK